MEDSVVIQAERIAGDFLLEQVKTSYQIIGKGITNQVCVVETESRKVVVRMNNKDSYPTYMKEKWCIEQAAAIGIPHPKWDERPLLLVVREDGSSVGEEEIQTFLAGEVA